MKSTLAALALALPLASQAAVENYPLDSLHSYPNFWVEHFGLSQMHGRFDKMTGKFSFDRAAKTGAVELTIAVASLTTGDSVKGSRPQSRDDHLRAADFFNAAEFPNLTFKSTKVNFSGELPASVEGNFTMLGVTRPITLSFERFKCGQHPFTKKDRCGGNAVGKIKRSDFGMKTAIPAVGDEITLNIGFEGDKE
ncbi:MAG: polyisoprenoid-binding protein [Burkholderiaceae bacterium]|nr:polyisoprenoid-binding protein [Burkholderiaceae bacterium]